MRVAGEPIYRAFPAKMSTSMFFHNIENINLEGDWQALPDGSIKQGGMLIKNIGGRPAAEALVQRNRQGPTIAFGNQTLDQLGVTSLGAGLTIGRTPGVENPWIMINGRLYTATRAIDWREGKLYLDGKLTVWA